MRCTEARQFLGNYVDSELDPATSAAVVSHLESCAECNRRFAEEAALEAEIGARLRLEAMPDDVWTRIRSHLVDRPGSHVRRLRPRASIVTLSAVALLALTIGAFRIIERLDGSDALVQSHLTYEGYASSMPGTVETTEEAETLLASRLGFVTSIPRSGNYSGHEVRFVGARPVEHASDEAVQLLYICCDHPVSVIFSRGSAPGYLVAMRRNALAQGLDVASREGESTRIVVLVRDHSADGMMALFKA